MVAQVSVKRFVAVENHKAGYGTAEDVEDVKILNQRIIAVKRRKMRKRPVPFAAYVLFCG